MKQLKNKMYLILFAFLMSIILIPMETNATTIDPLQNTAEVNPNDVNQGMEINTSMSSSWVVIKDYSILGDRAIAGETGTLSIDLKNTNSKQGVLNVLLTFSGGSDDVLIGDGSTNQVFIDYIPAGEEKNVEVPIKIAENAFGERAFNVELKYIFMDKEDMGTNNVLIHFPVYRSSVAINDINFDDNKNEMSIDYTNCSINDIYGLVIKVIGDTADNMNVEVGDVKAGESKQISIPGTFYVAGKQNLKISYSYMNAKGEAIQSEDQSIVVDVKKADSLDSRTDNNDVNAQINYNTKTEIGMISAICAIIVIFTVAIHSFQLKKSSDNRKKRMGNIADL